MYVSMYCEFLYILNILICMYFRDGEIEENIRGFFGWQRWRKNTRAFIPCSNQMHLPVCDEHQTYDWVWNCESNQLNIADWDRDTHSTLAATLLNVMLNMRIPGPSPKRCTSDFSCEGNKNQNEHLAKNRMCIFIYGKANTSS